MTIYRLTERYDGERDVWVKGARSKFEALRMARAGDLWDIGEPSHSNYRYTGPVVEDEAREDDDDA